MTVKMTVVAAAAVMSLKSYSCSRMLK